MKKLIITGDDFGFSLPINEAVEEAHHRGILTTASLMVRGTATADAVERARRLPSLKVGLHLALVDGFSVLPPEAIPNLVDQTGRLSSHLIGAGMNFFFRPKVKQQLEAEIRAQFEAFQKTGLSLDHVNTHHHMHLHPTVLRLILKVGRGYGMRAVRFPYEPPLRSWHASQKALGRKILLWLFLSPWLALLKNRLKNAQVHSNHFIFGMNDSGHMNLDLVLRFVRQLPPGVTEIYFHPVVPEASGREEASRPQDDLEALKSLEVREALLASGIQLIAFSELQE